MGQRHGCGRDEEAWATARALMLSKKRWIGRVVIAVYGLATVQSIFWIGSELVCKAK